MKALMGKAMAIVMIAGSARSHFLSTKPHTANHLTIHHVSAHHMHLAGFHKVSVGKKK